MSPNIKSLVGPTNKAQNQKSHNVPKSRMQFSDEIRRTLRGKLSIKLHDVNVVQVVTFAKLIYWSVCCT